MSLFEKLAKIDTSKHVESKNGFNYLSWAWAWTEMNKHCTPKRNIVKDENGNNYHTDGMTCWVEVAVVAEDVEHVEMLPVMDFKNKSIPLKAVTSFDVNKAIQRCTVKCLALHGLGLNLYAGEDLPMIPTLDDMTPSHKDWGAGINAVQNQGWSIEKVRELYNITDENYELLKSAEVNNG